ncbi:excisionase family DNA-binding protein [Halobacillus salinarum]|uniref:Excisionase family DNA-binding protein n=1 Tax=Halobacillus salinarum TaxID=2932257 RepID=A0ABY4EIT1_9BACI|nr:excisionase family DNA-binding protein [Halobacillus salinarum]UOQ43963.1 excisionase family DNA-binding protein [Halobacillus salinarum]
MYLTVEETAGYLDLPEEYVLQMIRQRKIRTVSDGVQVLINKNQFSNYFEQLEMYREWLRAYLSEPIPEDPDVKDED